MGHIKEPILHSVSVIKHHVLMVFLFLSINMLMGCGQTAMDELVPVSLKPYAQVDRMTTTVMRGNLTPVYEGEIELCGYEEIAYRVEDTLFRNLDAGYEAKVKAVHVQTGDRVKKGDVMLSFTSDLLEERLMENERTKRHAELAIEHYRKVNGIDPLTNFAFDIDDLKDDIALAQVYIDDVDKIYAQLNVVAEKDGIVTFVDPSVMNGFLKFGSPMFKVVSDDGYYMAQPWLKGIGDDSLEKVSFAVGERFHAKSKIAEYEVEVIPDPTKLANAAKKDEQNDNRDSSVSDNNIKDTLSKLQSDDSNLSGASGGEKDKVYFKIVGGSDRISEQKLTIYKNMEEIKNVCYVEAAALIQHTDSTEIFAYKQTPEGNFVPVQVKVGNVIGEYAVVVEGLTEGDIISIPPDVDYRDVIKPNSKKTITKEVVGRDGEKLTFRDDGTVTVEKGNVAITYDVKEVDK